MVMIRVMVVGGAVALIGCAGSAGRRMVIGGSRIGNDVVVVGDLGVPVGQEITIEGHKQADGPLADMFWVDTVDGKRLPGARGVEVVGIGGWRDGTVARLRGREVGTLRYVQLGDTNVGPDPNGWKGAYQRLFLRFEVSEVIAPAGITLDGGK
ncbi:MAG TPA: hypothetical protein VHQ47_03665 [Phycisphaerae bacterium]|nr:hypothetical protein [Phycisphaerae bacterium]